jgi:hypothetical protein|tara:strand:+ start:6796 stop:7257 length:462 start_codon:yes stop_codon:yes gene_type:complete
MKLSTNFTTEEFTRSQTAIRQNIDNTPTEEHIENMQLLCEMVLQPVREHFGPIAINSGYRGTVLNKAIGGSWKSQHCLGQAADIECPGTSNRYVAQWISDNCTFDQVILEYNNPEIPDSGWVHVSYNRGSNRMQRLRALKEDGKTVYKNGLTE